MNFKIDKTRLQKRIDDFLMSKDLYSDKNRYILYVKCENLGEDSPSDMLLEKILTELK